MMLRNMASSCGAGLEKFLVYLARLGLVLDLHTFQVITGEEKYSIVPD